jgi:hypothetical protein
MSLPVANVPSTLGIRTQTESLLSAAFVFGGRGHFVDAAEPVQNPFGMVQKRGPPRLGS